jgi:uncharacterized membrane protein (UPF0127 family)
MKIFCVVLTLLFLLLPEWVCAKDVVLTIGSHNIYAEVADTQPSRDQGLMQRNSLCPSCGMLFVFEDADRYIFWMKNTSLPLSIAFISAKGRIINIEEMEPNTTNLHQSFGEAQYALEMNSGWFTKNKIRPDFKVRGLKRQLRKY